MPRCRLLRGTAGDEVFVVHDDRREPAQDVGRRGDHPGPERLGMTVERHGVVGQALGQELERQRLLDLISRLDGRQGRLGGEMGRVAGDARRGFVVQVGDAIERVPLARGVGVPAIAGQKLKVHRGADRPPGGRGDRRSRRRDRPLRASGTAARRTAWSEVDTRAGRRRPRRSRFPASDTRVVNLLAPIRGGRSR